MNIRYYLTYYYLLTYENMETEGSSDSLLILPPCNTLPTCNKFNNLERNANDCDNMLLSAIIWHLCLAYLYIFYTLVFWRRND